jgi:hypothetical protein
MLLLKYTLPLVLLLAATSASSQTTTNKAATEVVTVCEVLGNRGAYDGKTVALIGRWSATEEGFWLADDCFSPVKTGEYVWRNIIFLAYDPSSPSLFSTGPKLDGAAVSAKIDELKARSKKTADKLEWAVVYGRIETKEEIPTVDDGKPRPAGYGHLNGAPAQIVYREKDLVLLPCDPR